MGSMDVFIRERNVEMYLDRLYTELDADKRATLVRLLVDEESQMARSREHLDNGERRVAAGLVRVERQRQLVARMIADDDRMLGAAKAMLETLQATQVLLEAHCRRLRHEFETRKF
ncbi:hypothetical protein SAMN02745126_06093 [Enhydrobacter aerosaccus]|uniref:Uncharacterized protein n=1 Tax=Enhydrobacter aerosaccus TaxID=225324 RepID=A0A1T4TEW6_9HYPH|nr:hypothetical protein [Enhydrobacter aerosaccus]SKA38739.1 hypothetical protein SAMN02745126_06093 [Enhydrobacter aerosaccus]